MQSTIINSAINAFNDRGKQVKNPVEKEADVAPEDTFGTITQMPYAVRDFPRGVFEAGEPSSAHDSSYVGGLAPRALRRDL
ncbi:hypothetical protein Tco_0006114 [Tanacetum coccineum]